jgi:hypothetical protein
MKFRETAVAKNFESGPTAIHHKQQSNQLGCGRISAFATADEKSVNINVCLIKAIDHLIELYAAGMRIISSGKRVDKWSWSIPDDVS